MKPVHDFSVADWQEHLEQRHATEIKLGLSRVKHIGNALGLLQPNCPCIIVAGTNGKGSTIAALEAIYTAAGYQVGAYTSPHLLAFNERIRINQQPISDAQLIQAFSVIHCAPDSTQLTYFEMVTLAALWHFKQNTLDIILLEVGMGGRLDATNSIDADLAIITTIDLDHEAFLGDTREAIAVEKAGVFRKKQLAIYADDNPPQSLLSIADALQIKLLKFNHDYSLPPICQQALNIHPKAFAAAEMASTMLQNKLPVAASAVRQAAKNATILARQQWLNTRIPTCIDVAHNAQSVQLLADYISTYPVEGKIHAVFSGLQDKNLLALMRPMQPYIHAWYLTQVEHTRTATKASLQTAYTQVTNKQALAIFNEPVMAYTAAVDAAKPGDVIIVYGSFLLVSAVINAHFNQEKEAEHELSHE
jgi:dihydrofolate synthase / folylpolyglutamate synthase